LPEDWFHTARTSFGENARPLTYSLWSLAFTARYRLQPPRANPAKVEDFGDKDLLQHIDLARILFSEVIPLRRDARLPPCGALV
jgi:hypothetical protein